MFTASLTGAVLLKKALAALKVVSDELLMFIRSDGLTLQLTRRDAARRIHQATATPHASNLAVILKLRPQLFADYDCQPHDATVSAISASSLAAILGRASRNDAVQLSVPSATKLRLEIGAPTAGCSAGSFGVVLVPSEDGELVPVEPIERTTVKMPSAQLKHIVTALANVGDVILLQVSDNTLTFDAPGAHPRDRSTATFRLLHSDPDGVVVDVNDDDDVSIVSCPSNLLMLVTRACSVSDTAFIFLDSNRDAIMFRFYLPNRAGFLRYLINCEVVERN